MKVRTLVSLLDLGFGHFARLLESNCAYTRYDVMLRRVKSRRKVRG
jgi:hypothetical protein